MSTYVISDIHGEYDMFLRLLEKIKFSERDTLYVLGDVLDRGPHPIKVLLEMMKYPNILPVVGNHEVMGISGLRFLMKEITEENIEAMDEDGMQNLLVWQALQTFILIVCRKIIHCMSWCGSGRTTRRPISRIFML